jgi:UDP-N-acetylmuramoyl-tripeptide--D-alanyl-D-alanine ligase
VEAIQSRAEVSDVRFSTAEIAGRLRGDLVGPEVTVDGVTIDSRSTAPGQLFIPIVAARDGHAFIAAAQAAGAAAYLTSRPPVGGTAILVPDTMAALTELGVLSRQLLDGQVIGITGSVGKTTTKDLLARCLASTFRIAASVRSLNNELGVPLTLCNAPPDARWIVLEMGARGVGHIAELATLTQPEVGIVTSVAMAHIEFFGDLEGVFRGKSELVQALPPSGVAVLNADDERVARMAALAQCPVLTYGVRAHSAEVRAEAVTLNADLQPHFSLLTPWGGGEVALRLHGEAHVSNALAAAAAALWCGTPLGSVLDSLSRATGSDLRMDVRRPRTGPALIIDCYNANPLSTEAALHALARLSPGKKMALLGRMAELGDETEHQHRRMVEVAEQSGISVVGYRTELYGTDHIDTVDEAVALAQSLGEADALLLKGSRVVRLEEVVRAYGAAIGDPELVP